MKLKVKAEETLKLQLSIPNPKIAWPNKLYKFNFISKNPNIIITTDVDLNNITSNEPTIVVDLNANILIEDQTPWYIDIDPGYYYMNKREYYLFNREQEVFVELLTNNNFYKLTPLPIQGSPIVVVDDMDIIYSEVLNDVVVNETLELIDFKDSQGNISKGLVTSYTNIDIDTIRLNDNIISGITTANNLIILPSVIISDTVTELTVVDNIILLPNINDINIEVKYKVNNSFSIKYYDDYILMDVNGGLTHNIYYDTIKSSKTNININPLRNSKTNGFIYIKD